MRIYNWTITRIRVRRMDRERERERFLFFSPCLTAPTTRWRGWNRQGQDRSEVVVTASRRFIERSGRRPDEWLVHATLVRLAGTTVGITHTRPLAVSQRVTRVILFTYELYLRHHAAKFARCRWEWEYSIAR